MWKPNVSWFCRGSGRPLHVAIVAFVAAPPSQYSSTKVPYNVDEIKGVDYDNEVMPEY